MARIDEQLERLATLSPAELASEWRRVLRADPPRVAPELLRLGIAHRLQERAHGGLSRSAAGALRSLTGGRTGRQSIKPGTRLVRSWNGRTIAVLWRE